MHVHSWWMRGDEMGSGSAVGLPVGWACPRQGTAVPISWPASFGLLLNGSTYAPNSDHLTAHAADEISTGLDSNTTYQICKGLKNFTHVMQASLFGGVRPCCTIVRGCLGYGYSCKLPLFWGFWHDV